MLLKGRQLDSRIHDFMDRKAIEYPDLHLDEYRDHDGPHDTRQVSTVRPHSMHGRIADVF